MLTDGPRCPPGLEYLKTWAMELFARSGLSEVGVNPVSFAEIAAWSRLTGREPSPLEVDALLRIDAALRDRGESEDATGPTDAAEPRPVPAWPNKKPSAGAVRGER